MHVECVTFEYLSPQPGVLASCEFSCLDCSNVVRQGQGLQSGTHSIM